MSPSATVKQRWFGWMLKFTYAIAGLFFFILALQLLKEGATAYGKTIIGFLNISNPVNTLGFGWLLAYLFLSGSPVAAIAISFFAAGTISALQTFTMITGSRLGASFIVLFVGFLYYLRGHQRGSSIAIGVLSLLVTAFTYIPAMFLGIWMLNSGIFARWQINATSPLASFLDLIFDPIMGAIKSYHLPSWIILVAGVLTLLGAFNLLDRALPEMTSEGNAFKRIGTVVYRPLAMFLLGGAITSVTMSVSVSISILVPLSARGLIRRENTLPYIMGANITTFIDTLVAALIAGGPAAFTVVLVEMLSVTVISLLVLAINYRSFERLMLNLQEAITVTNRRFSIFLVVMLVIPLILLLVK